MLFIVRGSTDYAIKSFTIFFIFLEGVQIMPSNHLECYSFLEEYRLCHQIIYNVIYFFRGSTDYAIKSFRMLFIFLEGVQIMPSNHLECYLFY